MTDQYETITINIPKCIADRALQTYTRDGRVFALEEWIKNNMGMLIDANDADGY